MVAVARTDVGNSGPDCTVDESGECYRASPTPGTAEAHAWTEGCRAFIAATYGQPSTMINQAYHTLVSNYPEFEEAAEARGYRYVNEVFTACGGTVSSEMKATLKLGRKAHWLVAAAAAASGLACAPPHGARLYSEGTWRVPSEVPTGTYRVVRRDQQRLFPLDSSMHVRHGWDYSSGGRAVCVVGSDAAFVEFTVIGGMARIERLNDSTTSPATNAWPNICGSQHTQPCRTLGRGQPRRRADMRDMDGPPAPPQQVRTIDYYIYNQGRKTPDGWE